MQSRASAACCVLVLTYTAAPASAIPAFARKYHTSCETCHTIYPKLTPFGEAFRRNGYRYPGHDSDFVKEGQVTLGQEAYKDAFPDAIWPGTLAAIPALALGFNGTAVVHPDAHAGAAIADNGARFTLDDLVAEAQLWAGGSFDDTTTYFAEVTATADGVEIEHAELHFNDLVGPPHAVNLTAGKAMSTLSSFGPHSSYIADVAMPMVPVGELWGAQTASFAPGSARNGVALHGTIVGRFDYAAGLLAGTSIDTRDSEDVYAQAGVKLGGATLDGESGPTDLAREHAITLDAFAIRARSRFTDAAGDAQDDVSYVFGGAGRGQWATLELDSGLYYERDHHALSDGRRASSLVQWNELSWLVYPWLAAAARVEYLRLSPSAAEAVSEVRIVPGVAALVRPNLKLTLSIPIERAHGAPTGGWAPAGGAAIATSAAASDPAPVDKLTSSRRVGPEVEAIELGLSCAF